MATIRKHNNKWQSIVRVVGYPQRTQSFTMKSDAVAWSKQVELDIQRDLHNLKKIKYPTFKECLERYRDEIIVSKRSKDMESRLVKYILTEGFVNFPINKIDSAMIASYRDRALKSLKSSSVNRRLAIISHLFTICRKEWDYKIPNPVLSIRRPTNPEPRDRHLTDKELERIMQGNRTRPHMKFIIELALETAMRRTEIANIKAEHVKGSLLKIPDAKTGSRTIPLTPKAQMLLRDNLPIRMSSNAIHLAWVRMCKHYGIKDCHFHDTRHMAIHRFANKKNIFPTPVIGGVGLIKKIFKPLSHSLKKDKSFLILVGKTFGHLGQSCFLQENYSITEGKPPEVNLTNEKNNGEAVLKLINENLIDSAHDVSNGGLLVALSEMTISSNLGVKIEKPKKLNNTIEYFFGEDQGRYILEIDESNFKKVDKILKTGNIFYEKIGVTQQEFFEVEGELKIAKNDLFKINNQWYNNY